MTMMRQKQCYLQTQIIIFSLITGSLAFRNTGIEYKLPSTIERQKRSALRLSAKKLRPGSLEAATAELGQVPYGESSRKYRRTIYTHDDWLNHRSNDRLIGNLFSMFYSGIVRQVKNKLLLVSSVALFLIIWNDFLCGYLLQSDFSLPHLALPVFPFTLSSPALGLLLVFRTNSSYQRWLEGRARWGTIVSQSRNMIRMAGTFADTTTEEGKRAMDDLARAVWVSSRTTMNTLAGSREDDQAFEEQLREAYEGDDCDFVNRLLSAPDRSSAALMEASLALDEIPVDEKRRVETDKGLVIIGNAITACDRIFSSPVPLVYTRHLARFLSVWMMLFPFAIHNEFVKAGQTGLPTLPATALLSLFFFGIEELAVQLEEPFSILPMQNYCDEIKDSAKGMIDWSVDSRNARKKVDAPDEVEMIIQ